LHKNIIIRFAYPKILIIDKDIHFKNEIINIITSLVQINHEETTCYNPQTKNETQQMNQTLIKVHKKFYNFKND
jgi:hypothetical protein